MLIHTERYLKTTEIAMDCVTSEVTKLTNDDVTVMTSWENRARDPYKNNNVLIVDSKI